ncbi:hypothetical protein KP509_23G016500 [Ceratopteris richardii]|uniref:Protein FAM91A1 n=1 Tax=Ceratopteris richardii TaxID=49495 RepID=A0A8T2RXB2_CERRI|nr:hypothetical protein KP509_23G016500 [Ceratopteris richardii]
MYRVGISNVIQNAACKYECRGTDDCQSYPRGNFLGKSTKAAEGFYTIKRRLAQELFPYHLAEYVCRIQRISPFKYYSDILYDVMKNERPYDTIPNFTAADALRLTGIGRNEFIDIMNKCRAKRIMWKLNKAIIKEMMPTQPVTFTIESWWTVCVVNLSLEEFRKLSEDEIVVIDKICKEEVNIYGMLDPDVVHGLYRRGLVYLDVPVFPDDYFKVSNLQGFVSNREQTYEDPTEELLYAVFVATSEHATIAELAATLQADLSQLEAAVSLACRLGWAKKVMDPVSLLQDFSVPGSPASESNGLDEFNASGFLDNTLEMQFDVDPSKTLSNSVRLAFMVDANLTSYLMMGSLSPGMKGHAVTLYEAGKLNDAMVGDLCEDLQKVEGAKFEGELQEFANHALSLRHALECLRSSSSKDLNAEEAFEVGDDIISDDFNPRVSDSKQSVSSRSVSRDSSSESNVNCDTYSDNSNRGRAQNKKSRYRVDVLRCESLAGLSPISLQRLLRRDYGVIVSMVPLTLPPGVVSTDGTGPVQFTSPTRAAVTPWMKLLLYSVAGRGPISVALVRGQRLRRLPPPLYSCEKALVWSWDGSGVGGIGGKYEGSLVDGSILLHCLNSLLRYSAVLVQPFTENDLMDGKAGRPLVKDIPLPLDNSGFLETEMKLNESATTELNEILTSVAEELHLWTMGYVRIVRVCSTDNPQQWSWVPHSVDFGIPLFNVKLCQLVCERIVQSELLQPASLQRQKEAMQKLRQKLQDFVSSYQANGSVSRSIYGRDQTKEAAELSSLISGKWNPFVEAPVESPSNSDNASSGIETGKKRFDRRRRRSEVMSFDGDILRSFPLTPVYEANVRLVDDSSPASASAGPKQDPFDENESSDLLLPGVNFLFNGTWIQPLDIGPCLQGRIPAALVAEAATASISKA